MERKEEASGLRGDCQCGPPRQRAVSRGYGIGWEGISRACGAEEKLGIDYPANRFFFLKLKFDEIQLIEGNIGDFIDI